MQQIQENCFRLTLYDTLKTPRLERDISTNDVVMMENEEGSSGLVFEIHVGRPIYETDSSWIEDKKIYLPEKCMRPKLLKKMFHVSKA